jgi:hypothetical protein
MTFSLVLLAALAPSAPGPGAPGGAPPAQAVAVIDGEAKLRITQASMPCGYGYGPSTRDVTWTEKRGADTVQVTAKVKVTSVVLVTSELPAKMVEAYTVDGVSIPYDKLAEMLAKEHTVLVSIDGKKVDPFLLQLYKEGTIVLVPPANALSYGGPYDTLGPGKEAAPSAPGPATPNGNPPRDKEP